MKYEVVMLQTIDRKLRVWQVGAQASKFVYKLIECIIEKYVMMWNIMQKYVPLVLMKFEVFILGGQRIDQKRKKGWWQREDMKTRDNWVNLKRG